MANVSLRASCPRLVAHLCLVTGLILGLTLMAQAQPPAKGKADKTEKTDKKTEKKSEKVESMMTFTDEGTNIINKGLSGAWAANKLTPAERCDDFTFIRRASLDIIGRIAKIDEIEKYMSDPPSTRRQLLVDRLLSSPEFSQYWATMWTHWLMTRTGDRLYKDQVNLWLEEMFESNDMSIKDMATKLLTATGKSNDNGAVNYILGHLGGPTSNNNQPNQGIWEKQGQFDMVPITSRTVRLFLGYQIQCTQCHDHPFNADWKQKHFWGVNAFFRQTERVGTPQMRQQMQMGPQQLTLRDNDTFNKSGIIFFEKRNGVFLPSEPVFLDGTRLPKKAEGTRREILAKFITNHSNFPKAYINRIWAHMFSRGLNSKPAFDDFGEHNEVVHEEMLTELANEFIKAKYNPRQLIRWIALSDAYQLKAVANKSNDSAEAEPYFSRMMLKSMSPEQLLESLIVATRPDASKDEEALKKFRADWMSRLTVNFGDDEGNEGTYNGTVVQALLMMNGRDINAAISNDQSGTVKSAMKLKTAKQMMDYIFLATLNRPATQKEYTSITQKLGLPRNVRDTPGAPLQDLFWALLNCNEFFLNH